MDLPDMKAASVTLPAAYTIGRLCHGVPVEGELITFFDEHVQRPVLWVPRVLDGDVERAGRHVEQSLEPGGRDLTGVPTVGDGQLVAVVAVVMLGLVLVVVKLVVVVMRWLLVWLWRG